LRQIYSTGSPLAATQYDYVYSSIKRDVLLASITGQSQVGLRQTRELTVNGRWHWSVFCSRVRAALPDLLADICSLFAGVNSALPVYRGELQCRMLGMAVNAVLDSGAAAPRGVPGELVCTRPAPCFPAGFWPLPGFGSDEAVRDAQERYHAAYFVQVPGGVWCACMPGRVCLAARLTHPQTTATTSCSRHRAPATRAGS
jgi:acetoacetyl-CoA synthetase